MSLMQRRVQQCPGPGILRTHRSSERQVAPADIRPGPQPTNLLTPQFDHVERLKDVPIVPTRMLPPLAAAKSVPRNADVLVVGMSEAGVRKVPESIARAFAKRFGVSVEEMAVSLGAKADPDSKRTLPAAGGGPRIVVGGVRPPHPNEQLAAGGAARV